MESRKKEKPKRPITSPNRYEYTGFFTTHFGVVGDEFHQKLQARELAKEKRKAKRKGRWGW